MKIRKEEKIVTQKMKREDVESVLENITIRSFEESDAEEIANLVIRNFREVNIKDYGEEAIEEMVKTHNADWVRQLVSFAHMYVFCHEGKIVACGSIASYWGSPTESTLLTVFVQPEYHGMGIGRTIIRTLEEDELFTRASRIEIPSSITAVEFYKKFGYNFKDGKKEIDGEGLYRLEKFREAKKLILKLKCKI